jgi:hypothetical protein
MVKCINVWGIARVECIYSIFVFHYQVGKVGYSNLVSLELYRGVQLVVEWPSNVSGRNLIKGILVVVVDQPFMFFTNVVLASFECFF